MKHFISFAAIFIFLARANSAQAPPVTSQGIPQEWQLERILREIETRDLRVDQEIAAFREAQFRQQEFERKVNRFAAIWNRLFASYRSDHVLNVKEARALAKAFHDLVSASWPK